MENRKVFINKYLYYMVYGLFCFIINVNILRLPILLDVLGCILIIYSSLMMIDYDNNFKYAAITCCFTLFFDILIVLHSYFHLFESHQMFIGACMTLSFMIFTYFLSKGFQTFCYYYDHPAYALSTKKRWVYLCVVQVLYFIFYFTPFFEVKTLRVCIFWIYFVFNLFFIYHLYRCTSYMEGKVAPELE